MRTSPYPRYSPNIGEASLIPFTAPKNDAPGPVLGPVRGLALTPPKGQSTTPRPNCGRPPVHSSSQVSIPASPKGAAQVPPGRPQKMQGLEGMRAFAALWVLVHHGVQAIRSFMGDTGPVPLLYNGYLGVSFFFILSGFIIAHSVTRLPATGAGLRHYALARMLRIYIPYLPVGVAMYLLYHLLPGLSQNTRDISALTSFTLLPSQGPPALSVAWTLVHEMIFYAVFALWFVSKRLLWAVLTLWGGIIVWGYFHAQPPTRLLGYGLSPLNLCFLLGVVLAQIKPVLPKGRIWVWMVAGAGAGCVLWQGLQLGPNQGLVAIGFGLVIMAAASPHLADQRVPSWVATLGAASYAIYLVHDPVLSITVRLVAATAPQIGVWPGFILISVTACLAGVLYWKAYETPALQAARRLIQHRSGRQ